MSATPGASRFGRYRVRERLGTGGMAQVYRATIEGPEGFQRDCVVKRMLPHLSKEPGFVQMLLDEARLSALLHHASIVQVQELGEIDGEYFIAMEYVDGHDLGAVVRECQAQGRLLPIGLACYVAHELAAALAYAHRASDDKGRPLGIIHRDVSPSNVMIARQGAVKLLDFGIAKAAISVRDEHTRTGALRGKLGYLSPEQVEGETIDHRSDIFALGVVLWECLVGDRLFRGDNQFHSMALVRRAEIVLPSALRPEIDSELDAIVEKLLARRPEDRYASCDEVLRALGPVMHRLEGDARAMSHFLDGIGLLSATESPTATASLPPASSSKKRRWPRYLVASLLVLAGGALAFSLRARPAATPSAPPTVNRVVAPAPSPISVAPPPIAKSPPEAAPAAPLHHKSKIKRVGKRPAANPEVPDPFARPK
jgi:serine/threonine-protein kinase